MTSSRLQLLESTAGLVNNRETAPLRVLALTPTPVTEGCTAARIFTPLRALEASGRVEYILACLSPNWIEHPRPVFQLLHDLPQWDIVWVSRPIFCVMLPFIRAAQQLRKPILIDFDDWLIDVPIEHSDAASLRHPALQQTMRMALRSADAITVSTPLIADQCAAIGLTSHLLPNAVDCSQFVRQPCQDDVVTIAYCGSASHAADVPLVAPALRRLLAAQQERVRVVSLGCPIPGLQDLVGYTHYERVSATEYARCLSDLHVDIGLAPLLDTPFNRAKSDIKYLEYSVVGAATIASPVAPYLASLRPDRGVLASANTVESWTSAIMQLVEQPQLRQSLAGRAYEWVRRERSIEATAMAWHTVFNAYVGREKAQGLSGLARMDSGQFRRMMANVMLREAHFYGQVIQRDLLQRMRPTRH